MTLDGQFSEWVGEEPVCCKCDNLTKDMKRYKKSAPAVVRSRKAAQAKAKSGVRPCDAVQHEQTHVLTVKQAGLAGEGRLHDTVRKAA